MKTMVRRRWELAAGGTSDLFELITAGSAELIADALAGLPEERRRAVGVELTAWFKAERAGWWGAGRGIAMAVAVVGCLPTAAQAAAILTRRAVSPNGEWAAALVTRVAEERGSTWLPDLAQRMAVKLHRDAWVEQWRFVAALLPADTELPAGDRFVELWVLSLGNPPPHRRGTPPVPLVDRLRTDRLLPLTLPRLFEIDGIGTSMAFDEIVTDWANRRRTVLPAALAQLAAEGVIDRGTLIDGAVGRLLRGDKPAALRVFTALLDQLQPTTDEVTERTTDYLRLLADAPSTVATMAQKALRDLPGLELDAVLDTSREVLVRPDKALVRGQLTWLDRLARQHRDRAAEIADVIAVAIEHPAADVRDRATALAGRYGHAPAGVDSGTAVSPPRGDELLPPGPPRAAPAPITDIDELAEEVAALLGTEDRSQPLDRLLDGLVRLTATDGDRVHAALAPVLARRHWSWSSGEHRWDPCCLCGLISEVLESAGASRPEPTARSRWIALLAAIRRTERSAAQTELVSTNARVPSPHALLRARLAEIGHHLGEPGYPGLLAAPTSVNGALDPLVLWERLTALGDRTPWHWDLTQALLRLPAGVDDALAGKAEALGTAGGERLAAWLRSGGMPQPVMRLKTLHRKRRDRHDWQYLQMPAQRVVVELRPPDGYDDRYGLLTADPVPVGTEYSGWLQHWPSVLPHHPGVVAAHALPQVASVADMDSRDGASVLPLLAECDGPGGVAVDLALAYGLGARHGADRIATLDALLGMAAAGRLDAAGVGVQLGALVVAETVKLTRVIEPLRDAAAAGAPLTVWRLLAAALPPILASASASRGLPDLLTLAAETATATGTRTELPGLAEVAGRGGSGRLVTEARRLQRALTGG